LTAPRLFNNSFCLFRIDVNVKKALIGAAMRVIEQSKIMPAAEDAFSSPFANLSSLVPSSALPPSSLISNVPSNLSQQQFSQLNWLETQRLALIETIAFLEALCTVDPASVLLSFLFPRLLSLSN
jgi:hypothetical protein